MSSPKKSARKTTKTASSDSSRSEAAQDDATVNLLSIQPRYLSPRVNRTTQIGFIKDVTQELPGDSIIACKMQRERRGLSLSYEYQLFGEEDEPIFIAKTESTMFSTKFSVIEPISGSKIGYIQSNYTSLIYNVTGPNCEFKIEYAENFLGRHGPRSFKVTFLNGDNHDVFVLKPPIVINGNYYQDFKDLATVPSIKNFICVSEKNFCQEVCVFVKNDDDNFTLHVTKPFSLFHGFCLALTSLHTGLFHR